jgi:hypothetical protein
VGVSNAIFQEVVLFPKLNPPPTLASLNAKPKMTYAYLRGIRASHNLDRINWIDARLPLIKHSFMARQWRERWRGLMRIERLQERSTAPEGRSKAK